MEAKERRNRHFRSSVGLMLNENYGDGLIPNTVQSQDFLYMPATDYPVSGPGLEFLKARLQDPHVHKPRSIGTSDSLYQAYRRAFGQPTGLVHYDRDPFYWKSKERPGSELGSFKSTSSSKFRKYAAGYNGYDKGPVPDVDPASTIKSVSTAKSLSRSVVTRPSSGVTCTKMSARYSGSKSVNGEEGGWIPRSKVPSGRLEDNRHRQWTPGSEAQGFKPYSPFSDSLQDFGKKEAKYIAPEIKPEVDRTCDVMPAPVYIDALKKVLDAPTDVNSNRDKADVFKLHGHPAYPSKVMEDKDVTNYIAWAKIYPYCPLTQMEGKENPVFVPPRGFTPSTPSKVGTIPTLRDMKKEKRKIMEGIALLSSSSKSRRGGKGSPRRNQSTAGNPENTEEIHPSLKTLPPSLAAKLNPAMKKDYQRFQTTTNNNNNLKDGSCRNIENVPTRQMSRSSSLQTVNYDPFNTRKLLDMKMNAPHGWYGGQTPTHTPTPDPALPIKATRAWIKHYSPARIRRFMRAIGGDASTP